MQVYVQAVQATVNSDIWSATALPRTASKAATVWNIRQTCSYLH